MARPLAEWIETEVRPMRDKSLKLLSQQYFFRDPSRATYSAPSYFFAPADGIILYQKRVMPDACIVRIKGKEYSLREAMRDRAYDKESLVIGIFMTFFDVHVNRVPYAGRLSYRLLDPIDTFNHPMLDVEKSILEDLRVNMSGATYLHKNQRMVNRVHVSSLGLTYFILQVADYDVDAITPFELKQNQPCDQGDRFSQIRFGSQVDLILPLSRRWEYQLLQQTGWHVEAGVDPLVRLRERLAIA